jgi:Cu+-exporting ATPase
MPTRPNYSDVVEAADRSPSAALPVTIVELEVSGMHCQSCVALIEETLVRVPGVRRAVVDLDSARASVDPETGTASVEELCAAVTGAGYAATPFPSPDRTS